LETIAQFFLKSSQNSCQTKSCQIRNHYLNGLFRGKCNKFVAQGIAILGYFFIEPTKSSLIGEKLPNLVTLSAI
jgi:hypothetical protein